MTTQSEERKRVLRRIRSFYEKVNKHDWNACIALTDPRLKIDHDLFAASLERLATDFGPLEIATVELRLYLNVPKNNFGDRPFAYGTVHWTDRNHKAHALKERWVQEKDGQWYSRRAGLV